ncbi:MAG: hypothetical protein ACT4PP_00230 [Sporichthyaceae bacterium]
MSSMESAPATNPGHQARDLHLRIRRARRLCRGAPLGDQIVQSGQAGQFQDGDQTAERHQIRVVEVVPNPGELVRKLHPADALQATTFGSVEKSNCPCRKGIRVLWHALLTHRVGGSGLSGS